MSHSDWIAFVMSPWFWIVAGLLLSGMYNDGYRAGRAHREEESLPYDWPHGDHDNDTRERDRQAFITNRRGGYLGGYHRNDGGTDHE